MKSIKLQQKKIIIGEVDDVRRARISSHTLSLSIYLCLAQFCLLIKIHSQIFHFFNFFAPF